MPYAFRWNQSRGPHYLASLDAYGRGEQRTVAFTTDPSAALTFGSVTEAVAAIQQRALNIGDTNCKLELVAVETQVRVGDAL
jgi:hypothetical protein